VSLSEASGFKTVRRCRVRLREGVFIVMAGFPFGVTQLELVEGERLASSS
jgi:hypothetical protein